MTMHDKSCACKHLCQRWVEGRKDVPPGRGQCVGYPSQRFLFVAECDGCWGLLASVKMQRRHFLFQAGQVVWLRAQVEVFQHFEIPITPFNPK